MRIISFLLVLITFNLSYQKIKRVEIADVSILRKGILSEYGLDIPSSALITIINRAKKRDYFTVDNGIYTVNEEKLKVDDNTKVRTEIDRAYNHVVNEIQKFCTENAPCWRKFATCAVQTSDRASVPTDHSSRI